MTTEQFTQAVSHRDRLAGFLNEYRRFGAELADLERKVAEAKTNEQAALNDNSADEAEVIKRMTEAQNQLRVHEARLASKRAQVSEALKRVESEFPFAQGELGNACAAELERRQTILQERILKAVGLTEAPRGHAVAELVESSPLVREVRSCQPDQNVVFSSRSIEAKAQDVLAKFAKLQTEKGKVI